MAHFCDFCATHFRSKRQFSEHVVFCEFMATRSVERNTNMNLVEDRIPESRMMFEGMKSCMSRLKKLEEENKELSKFVHRERRKIDMIDYLKMRYPVVPMDFSSVADFLKDIQQKHLECVFAGNIADGVCLLVGDFLDANMVSGLPICAFSHKAGVFFVYNKQVWSECSACILNDLFDLISNRFLGAYGRWEQKRSEYILETEDVKKQKMEFMKRILGTYLSDEVKYKKFRSFLFEKLKQNVKSIIEYEFV